MLHTHAGTALQNGRVTTHVQVITISSNTFNLNYMDTCNIIFHVNLKPITHVWKRLYDLPKWNNGIRGILWIHIVHRFGINKRLLFQYCCPTCTNLTKPSRLSHSDFQTNKIRKNFWQNATHQGVRSIYTFIYDMSVHNVDPSHLFANALAAHALAEIESDTHNQNSEVCDLRGQYWKHLYRWGK